MSPLSLKTLLVDAGSLLLEHYPKLTLSWVLIVLRTILVVAFAQALTISSPWSFVVWAFTAVFMASIGWFEFTQNLLNAVRSQKVEIFLRLPLSVYAVCFAASLVVGVIVAAGLVALIVPGIIVEIFSLLYLFAAIDKHGPLRSIKISWKIVRRAFWQTAAIATIYYLAGFFNNNEWLCGLSAAVSMQMLLALTIVYDRSEFSPKNQAKQ